jgi:hypothetical protein
MAGRVYAVGSGSRWDSRRNTSAQASVPPGSAAAAIAACRELREREPELVGWIEAGAPTLTEAEHRDRFGEPYRKASAGSRRPASSPSKIAPT